MNDKKVLISNSFPRFNEFFIQSHSNFGQSFKDSFDVNIAQNVLSKRATDIIRAESEWTSK